MKYALVKVNRFDTGSIKFLGLVNGLARAKYHAVLHAMCEEYSEVTVFRLVDNMKMFRANALFANYYCWSTNPPIEKEIIRGVEVNDYAKD